MLTSTIAWSWCTPCVQRARRAHSFTLDVVSHLIGSSPESFHIHPWSSSWRTLFDSLLPFYFYLFLPVFSFYFLHSELYSELDNPIVMESLCYSANKESEDAYDVSTSFTGYEPNLLTFGELNDKPITAKSVVFDGSGQPDGERNVDQSVNFGVTRNTYSAHSKFSENTRTEKMVDGSGKPDERDSSNAQIRTLLEEQRQTIIAEYREKVGHHELQAAHAEEERRLLQGQLWRQKLEFREAHQQRLTEMEELRKFQSSTFDTVARRKLIEGQNTILELSGRVQELHNEVNCTNDSKDFQDAESVRSGNSLVTSRPVSFPPHPIPEGMLKHSFVLPRREEGPPSIWDTHGISGNVFANPPASSSAPYPQELNQWNSSIEEPLHTSTVENSERPEQNQDLRCQSGPSAKNSVIFRGGDSSKNYGADQQRLQISDLHFDKFPTPATFACWKI